MKRPLQVHGQADQQLGDLFPPFFYCSVLLKFTKAIILQDFRHVVTPDLELKGML